MIRYTTFYEHLTKGDRNMLQQLRDGLRWACVWGVKIGVVVSIVGVFCVAALNYTGMGPMLRGEIVSGAQAGTAAVAYVDELARKKWLPAPIKDEQGRLTIPTKPEPSPSPSPSPSASPSAAPKR